MSNILRGLLVAFLLLCGMIAPASAALPADAYAGSLWDRIWNPTACVGHTIRNPNKLVLPKTVFGSGHAPAGTYVWWNARTGKCMEGGAAAGPQF